MPGLPSARAGFAAAVPFVGLALFAAFAASAPPSTTPGAPRTSREIPTTTAPAPAHPKDPRIADLDQQITALRADRKTQVDPLEAQLKALRERFDTQIDSLTAQRKSIVEAGESPALRELDEHETSELTALNDREKADIESTRTRYENEKKELRESYAAKRKAIAG